ncbi:MAG: RNA pyrophosphohydrolase [Rickettsiales bacterium]|nr:RNA pyrophosphohydrolase [Rickettsiales bacterium]
MAKSEIIDIGGGMYRKNVGIVLWRADGKVLFCRRLRLKNELYIGHDWQFPQGGLDEGEDAKGAALRELAEETGVKSVGRVHEDSEWLSYDFPFEYVRDGIKLAGQAQKWFLMEFVGEEDEIAIPSEEFVEYKWVPLSYDMADKVVQFKQAVYRKMLGKFIPVLAEFTGKRI